MKEGADPKRDDLLLQRRLDGELRPSERDELEQALAESPSLRQQMRRGELQAEFFEADRDCDQPPPLGLDFADRVLSRLDRQEAPAPVELVESAVGPQAKTFAVEEASIRLGPWILAAAVLLAVLLVGQFVTRPTQDETMRAGTREAEKILKELDRSPDARFAPASSPEAAQSSGPQSGQAETDRK